MAPKPKTVLAVFVGAHLVNDLYATVMPAFLPALADEFGLDYRQLGLLSAAVIVFSGVLQPVIGSAADRHGRRRFFLIVGFVIAAVGFLAMSVAPTYAVAVAVSSLVGLGASTYHPQASSYLVSLDPQRRGRMLGIHGWGGSFGHFLAPTVVVLGVAWIGWRPTMALLVVPMVVTAIVLRTTLDETEPSKGATLRGAIDRRLLMVAVAFGAIYLVGRSFMNFFVKMLVDDGWSDTSAGFLLTSILLLGAVAQPIGGAMFDRLGGRRVFELAAAATVALVGLFALSDGVVSFLAVAGIAFFMFSLFPVSLAYSSRLVPASQTGAATGVVFGVSGLMTAAAQPIVGSIAEATGDLRSALAWLLPVAIIGLIMSVGRPDETIERQAPTRRASGPSLSTVRGGKVGDDA